jgi:hypothetical protein
VPWLQPDAQLAASTGRGVRSGSRAQDSPLRSSVDTAYPHFSLNPLNTGVLTAPPTPEGGLMRADVERLSQIVLEM